MFASNGAFTPPCGVPASVSFTVPILHHARASSHCSISFNTASIRDALLHQLNQCRPDRCRRQSSPGMSASTTKLWPRLPASLIASSAPASHSSSDGNPCNPHGWKSASKIGLDHQLLPPFGSPGPGPSVSPVAAAPCSAFRYPSPLHRCSDDVGLPSDRPVSLRRNRVTPCSSMDRSVVSSTPAALCCCALRFHASSHRTSLPVDPVIQRVKTPCPAPLWHTSIAVSGVVVLGRWGFWPLPACPALTSTFRLDQSRGPSLRSVFAALFLSVLRTPRDSLPAPPRTSAGPALYTRSLPDKAAR